jgi:hypothetical protein
MNHDEIPQWYMVSLETVLFGVTIFLVSSGYRLLSPLPLSTAADSNLPPPHRLRPRWPMVGGRGAGCLQV